MIRCEGMNDDSLYMHSINGNIEIIRPDSVKVEREIHKLRTLLAGYESPDIPKEWLIEGKVKVEVSNGNEYLVNIVEPLYRIQGCRWPQTGVKVININPDDAAEDEEAGVRTRSRVVIDFSYVGPEDSLCDSYILRTVDDGDPEVIDLRR